MAGSQTLTPNTQITQENVGLLKAGDWLWDKQFECLCQFDCKSSGGDIAVALYRQGVTQTRSPTSFIYLASLPRLADTAVGNDPHEMFEHFIAEAISKSPQPLQDLGQFLTTVLDEHHWKTSEGLLLASASGAHGYVTDEWADRFCEAVNWFPDGQECKVIEGEARCITFREIAKGHILAVIATDPYPRTPDRPALSPPAEGEVTVPADLLRRLTPECELGCHPICWTAPDHKDADCCTARRRLSATPTPAPVDWTVVGPKLEEAASEMARRIHEMTDDAVRHKATAAALPVLNELIFMERAALATAQPEGRT